jgi:Domain of unknown function (DUF4190)
MSYYPPQQPGQYMPPAGQQTHTMAIVSLIFGILGLVGVCPGLGSIIALVTGNMAKGDIQRDPARYSGDGLAKGGIILGWIGVGLAVCGLCVGVIWLFTGGLAVVLGIMGASQSSGSWLPLLNGLWA